MPKIRRPENCPDCGVEPGELHDPGCDVERCPGCGHQALSCDDDHWEGLPRIPWTGIWPGVEECQEFGWYAKMTGRGWMPCGPDDEGATEDLNRLACEGNWNKETRRFERRS